MFRNNSIARPVMLMGGEKLSRPELNLAKIIKFMGRPVQHVRLPMNAVNFHSGGNNWGTEGDCIVVNAQTLVNMEAHPSNGAEMVRQLQRRAQDVFVFGFQPDPEHDRLLQSLTSGGLNAVIPFRNTASAFAVDRHAHDLCRQFAGLNINGPDREADFVFTEGTPQTHSSTLIRIGKDPFFVCVTYGGSRLFLLARTAMTDLGQKVSRRQARLGYFAGLVPFMMFLRAASGPCVWHGDTPSACFILDDPLLKRRYGFLNYTKLAALMEQCHFSTSIAFIPWNFNRTDPRVAALLSRHQAQFSLCVHGCDHTGAEFGSGEVEPLCRKADEAMRRMHLHHRLSGIDFDPVMVFPQGIYSTAAMQALKTHGYLAALNSTAHPVDKPEQVTLSDLLEVAVTRFSNLPLFTRHAPDNLAELAFDLFLGKPAFIVGHHDCFREGYDQLANTVKMLNQMEPRLRWTHPAAACAGACVKRLAANGDVQVCFFTDRFSICNDMQPLQTRRFVLMRRLPAEAEIPSFTLNGQPAAGMLEGRLVKFAVTLEAGEHAEVGVAGTHPQPVVGIYNPGRIFRGKVFLRRHLCEFRDNYLDKSRALARYARAFSCEHLASKSLVPTSRHPHADPTDSRLANRRSVPGMPPLKTAPENLHRKDDSVLNSPQMGRPAARYVLITPARDEAAHIRKTIEAMVAQTILPLRWVIVSDGSTDGTDDIVKEYLPRHNWIELVRMPDRQERHFGGKVHAFNAGYDRVRGMNYDIVGNVDGDASFAPDYMEFLLRRFAENPALGVAGTNYWESAWEEKVKYDYRFTNTEDVSGLCQLFRRECFEAFGGYKPSRCGGVDLIASIEARMHGWETRMFSDKFAVHHRQQGTAEAHPLLVEFYNGQKDFLFGGHALWEILRATYRLARKPHVIGGCLILAGYFWALAARLPKAVSTDLVRFRRREQMNRLRRMCLRLLGRNELATGTEPARLKLKPCPDEAGGTT